MSFKLIKGFASAASGISLYYIIKQDKLKVAYSSWTSDYKPSSE